MINVGTIKAGGKAENTMRLPLPGKNIYEKPTANITIHGKD